jgi:hypothetical protein
MRLLLFCILLITSVLCEAKAYKPANSQDFVVGQLQGQLGNQCFIIAAALSLALDHNATAVFPDLRSRQDENIPANAAKIFFRLNSSPVAQHLIKFHYAEPVFTYRPIPYQQNMVISGYFQSEKYFRHHKQEIINLFAPPDDIIHYLHDNYGHILSHPITVAVHIRSYVDEVPYPLFFNCDRRYYEHAMGYFPQDALFVVFSNNMTLCKKMLKDISRNMVFIEGEPHYHDFYLMSMCKHNIICNSSFSWWAAYLNSNLNKIVVCPPLWFNPGYGLNGKDVIPEEWYIAEY